MTIASEITRLQWAKADIKTAIENRWVIIPNSVKLDWYATYIGQIPSITSLATWTYLPMFTQTESSKERAEWTSQCFFAKIWWYYVVFGRFATLDYAPSRYYPKIHLLLYFKQEWSLEWTRVMAEADWPYDTIPPATTFEAWYNWTKLYVHDYSYWAGSSSNNYWSWTPGATTITTESSYSWSYNINNYTIGTAQMYISDTLQNADPMISIKIVS